ncbi:hypothetical protein [Adhaeretor mobilis]|uniref:hypothetical protein n=1 Tax=Adhaeretor mobilis TaxID=1930276 RepID=UPI00119FFCE1|nr:hypothetical protein [Adhaeretor mobilis]
MSLRPVHDRIETKLVAPHDHTDLLVLLAGGAVGNPRAGHHIANKQPTLLAKLHRTLLSEVGVPVERLAKHWV